jgi:hypothetical protein
MTWPNTTKALPTGKYTIRDAQGNPVIKSGDIGALWRRAISDDRRSRAWTSEHLGITPTKLKTLLVDLTG